MAHGDVAPIAQRVLQDRHHRSFENCIADHSGSPADLREAMCHDPDHHLAAGLAVKAVPIVAGNTLQRRQNLVGWRLSPPWTPRITGFGRRPEVLKGLQDIADDRPHRTTCRGVARRTRPVNGNACRGVTTRLASMMEGVERSMRDGASHPRASSTATWLDASRATALFSRYVPYNTSPHLPLPGSCRCASAPL